MTEYTCDSFRFFNLFPVYFGGKGTLGFHVHRSFAWFFPFRATQAYPKSEEKAITKTNNLSAKAGATNVTSNNGYVGGLFGGFHPSSMRVLRKPSISGGMVSSGCRTGWEGAA